MKALVITLNPESWIPSEVYPGHWHLVDTYTSRHVVTAVERTYKNSVVTEYEWADVPPICAECGKQIGVPDGEG